MDTAVRKGPARFCWCRGAPRQPGAPDPESGRSVWSGAEALEREKKAEVEALERRLARLKEEREQLPAVVDLDHALEMLAQAQEELSEAEARKERCLDQERSAKQVVALLEQQSRELSRGLPYMRTEEAYEEALNAAESYQALLGSLGISYSDLLHAVDAVEWTEDRIAELRDQADTQSRTNAQTRKQMEVSQARVRVIQEFLSRPENRARAQRRAELDREMEDQQERMSDAGKRCAALEAEQRGQAGAASAAQRTSARRGDRRG